MAETRSVQVRIAGRVQGVSFRVWTERRANALGLSGWVRNLANGDVEAVFSGPAEAVDAMLAACPARLLTPRAAELAALMPEKPEADTSGALLCPMPGLVVSIVVAEGQKVAAGETLATVEAMKMENVLRAERDAVVAKILVRPGDSLAVDAVIMEFA